jgi:hypothetical protein
VPQFSRCPGLGSIPAATTRRLLATLVVVPMITIAVGMIMPVGLDLAERVPNPFRIAGLEPLRHPVRSSIAFAGLQSARAVQCPTATAMRCRCGPGTASVAAAWGADRGPGSGGWKLLALPATAALFQLDGDGLPDLAAAPVNLIPSCNRVLSSGPLVRIRGMPRGVTKGSLAGGRDHA